jgi:hypothetical protein
MPSTRKKNNKVNKAETYVKNYSYHQYLDKMSDPLLLFSQDIYQHNDPSVGILHLHRGSTCSGENKEMMNEVLSLSIVHHLPPSYCYNSNILKLILFLMVKGDFSNALVEVNNPPHYSQG